MESSNITELLSKQKRVLEKAKGRKGQRATNKATREQLLFTFFNQGRAAIGGSRIRTTYINYAYPPCTTLLSDLQSITISELRLETHHVGRVLIVRTFTEAIRIQSVQTAIEDVNLDVDQLAVYNGDPEIVPSQALPNHTIFAIKEPLYKSAASGGYIIRVDHPSDLVKLGPTHAMIPTALAPRLVELEKDGINLKDVGNAAFRDRNYLSASEAYTQALEMCGENDSRLSYDLYRNRSIVNIYLQRFEQAASDATAALIPEAGIDEKDAKNNVKALYRAGRACYCLGKFYDAHSKFERLLEVDPTDRDGREQLTKTKARLEEASSGKYNFEAMSNSIKAAHKRLDHASFIANISVRTSNKKGRGLFATKDIESGELVFVEKAFSVVFESELGLDTNMILNLNTNTGNIGAHAVLFYNLVQKMLHNPTQAQRVLELFDGGYSPKCTAQVMDGVASIDTFQVAAIMQHNCFGCPNTKSADGMSMKLQGKASPSVGVWVIASYMNHACAGNAHRSFLGDCMIVRASKSIKKDEEIFITYRSPEYDNVETQRELEKTWKFTCTCSICSAEAKTSTADRKQRRKLIRDLAKFLEDHREPSRYVLDEAKIATAEELYAKLAGTYDKSLFRNVPCLPLAHLGGWLCSAYQHERNMHKILDTAKTVLKDLGYKIEMAGRSLEIDSTHCYAEVADIDAAMHAAHACFYYGYTAAGKQYEAFAKNRYLVLNGELGDFAKRYSDAGKM